MGTPDPAAYEAIADAVARQADALRGMGHQFGALGERATALIGGTSTATDRRMIQASHESQALLHRAAQQLADAANHARRAAREAHELAEAERRREESRRAGRS